MQGRTAVLVRSFFVPSFGGVGGEWPHGRFWNGGIAVQNRQIDSRPAFYAAASAARRWNIALTAAETVWKAQRNGAAAIICLFVLPCTGRRRGRSRPLPE